MAQAPTDRAGAVAQALQAVVLHAVRLLGMWLGVLFALFIPFDWAFTKPEAAGHVAAVLDAAASLGMFALFLLARRGVPLRLANTMAGLLALVALPYVLLNVWLTAVPVVMAGLALWQIGICLVFLSWRWSIGLLAVSNVLCLTEVLWGLHVHHLPPSDDWVQYGYILSTSTVIGLVAHGVRLNTYRRLETLRIEEKEGRVELQQAQAAAAELEGARRLNALKTEFINTAAHELATPLTPVLLQVRVLRQQAVDPEQRKALDLLERNLTRLRGLLQDVLDSARIQADRLPMQDAKVDVGKVAAETVAQYAEAAKSKGVLLEQEASGAATVVADPKRLHQVMGNLLSNALKFTPAGGRVHVRVAARGGDVAVEVSDSGLGIPPGEGERLFAPFVQLHAPEVQGGTGLGLYISKGIVQHYGGTIGCHSAGRGQGATFWFTLPAAGQDV